MTSHDVNDNISARPCLQERLAPNYKSANILEEWVVQSVSGEAEDVDTAGTGGLCSPRHQTNVNLRCLSTTSS
jgi:hypothetical protein